MGPSERKDHVHDGDISVRQFRLAVLAATLAFVAVVLMWSTITPPFRAVYEHENFNSIVRLEYGGAWREDSGSVISEGVWVAMQEAGFLTALPRTTVDWSSERFADVTPPESYSVIDASNARVPANVEMRDSSSANPPLYYQIQAAAAKAAGMEGADWRTQLQFARWVNILFALWIPGLIAVAARHISTKRWAAATVAFLPLAIPQLASQCATVSTMPLLITACLAVTATVTLVMHHGPTWRRTLTVGITLGLASLVSVFAVFMAPLVIGGFVLARPASKWFKDMAHAVGALGTAFAVGGAWWVTSDSFVAYVQNESRVSAFARAARPSESEPHAQSFWQFATESIPHVAVTFWGSFGYAEISVEPALAVVLSALLIAGTTLGIVFAKKYRVDAIVLSAFFALLFVVYLVIFYRRHLIGIEDFGFEGRFLFIGLGAVGAVFALGIAKTYALGHVEKAFPTWVPAGALGIGLFGLMTGFQGFYRPLNETFVAAWQRWTEWTPGGGTTVIVFLVFLALVLAAPLVVDAKILSPDNWEVSDGANRDDQRQRSARFLAEGDVPVDHHSGHRRPVHARSSRT